MAERRVAEVMDQRQRLGEILVAAQGAGQGAGNLRDFDRMGEPRAEMVALVGDENLRLVLEPAEGGRMDDAVAVTLERRAGWAHALVEQAATAFCRIAGPGRARPVAETDVAQFSFADHGTAAG